METSRGDAATLIFRGDTSAYLRYAIERDARAAAAYAANFGREGGACPELVVCDVAAVADAAPLPRVDVLAAGFPCQPFSLRGDQLGTDDFERGGLYLELCRFLKKRRPKAFLFENVVGLVLMGGGKRGHYAEDGSPEDENAPHGGFVAGSTLSFILDAFAACGYAVSWSVVNARHCVAQFRERVYGPRRPRLVGSRSRRRRGRDAARPLMNRGDAAAATRIVRGGESR